MFILQAARISAKGLEKQELVGFNAISSQRERGRNLFNKISLYFQLTFIYIQ